MIRGLSVRQPWAAAITYADKRVENRTWTTRYRGPLLLHAAKTIDRAAYQHPPSAAVVRGLRLDRGAVIAVARLVDCHEADGECTPWSAPSQAHLVLDDVYALVEPVPWRGALGLWPAPSALLQLVREQLDDARAVRLLDEGVMA